VFFVFHTIGAHFTYSAVPLGDWLQRSLDLDRNHFDRIVHLLFGLLLVCPFRDQITQASKISRGWGSLTAFLTIIALTTVYELVEWGVAVIVSPEDAMAYLGTQGDVFDAQKDSALAIVGAGLGLIAAVIADHWNRRRVRRAGERNTPATWPGPLAGSASLKLPGVRQVGRFLFRTNHKANEKVE
jgi:putative membrane protein